MGTIVGQVIKQSLWDYNTNVPDCAEPGTDVLSRHLDKWCAKGAASVWTGIGGFIQFRVLIFVK